MSVTPKVVRRNRGSCVCPNGAQRLSNGEYTTGACVARCCIVLRCTTCRGQLCSWGPVGCKCGGGPRWARHRGMGQPGHWDFKKDDFVPDRVAVKPSIARRR